MASPRWGLRVAHRGGLVGGGKALPETAAGFITCLGRGHLSASFSPLTVNKPFRWRARCHNLRLMSVLTLSVAVR